MRIGHCKKRRRQVLQCHHLHDGQGEVGGAVVAAQVGGQDLALLDDLHQGFGDPVGVVIQTQMTQHVDGAQQQSGRVGGVAALNVLSNVTTSGFENGVVGTEVSTGDETGSTDDGGTDVGQNVTVQVSANNDVELAWLGHQLHGRVVDNHVVELDTGALVLLRHFAANVQEKTITKLHDVSLVDRRHLLPSVLQGKVEGVLGDTLGLCAGNDLQ